MGAGLAPTRNAGGAPRHRFADGPGEMVERLDQRVLENIGEAPAEAGGDASTKDVGEKMSWRGPDRECWRCSNRCGRESSSKVLGNNLT